MGATVFQFKCTQFTAVGDEVFTLDQNTEANELQVSCISGRITIEGKTGANVEILGKPVSAITLNPGQAFNFTEIQYQEVTITVTDGSEAVFVANN